MRAAAKKLTQRTPAPAARPATQLKPVAAGKQTPRRLRRAAEILAAAREVFLERGFERAAVAEIAARVGVVESLVYSYFPTKRDLLNEVLRGWYEPLLREIEGVFAKVQGLRSRLRFLIWRHLRVYIENAGLSRLALHEVRTSPEYFRSVLHDLQVRYTAFLMQTLREAVASGELPPDTDYEMIRGMVYGGIEHRMWPQLFGRGSIDLESAADHYTNMVLNGILPAAAVPAGAGWSEPASARPVSDDIERRLARLERIVAGTAPGTGKRPSSRSTKEGA